jgi:hypothetical protein
MASHAAEENQTGHEFCCVLMTRDGPWLSDLVENKKGAPSGAPFGF